MQKQHHRLVAAVACAAVLALAGTAHAASTALSIVSDATWKASDVLEEDWEMPDYDDSAWGEASAPYPGITQVEDLILGTPAQFMWYDPDGTSNGRQGPVQTWYRKTFELALDPQLRILALAQIAVDDDFQFYVNGELAYTDASGGNPDVVHFIDFTDKLVDGTNTLAIYAVDGTLARPTQRAYEWVLFDASVRSVGAVPEPSTYALLLAGLAGVLLRARRRTG